jgi:hypothetical protein
MAMPVSLVNSSAQAWVRSSCCALYTTSPPVPVPTNSGSSAAAADEPAAFDEGDAAALELADPALDVLAAAAAAVDELVVLPELQAPSTASAAAASAASASGRTRLVTNGTS